MGQPELRATLGSPSLRQLKQRIGVWYHLTTLDREETASYMAHRLKVAGWEQDLQSLFAVPAIDLIFERTGGIPRLINILCDRALLAAFARGVKLVEVSLLEEAHAELEGASASL